MIVRKSEQSPFEGICEKPRFSEVVMMSMEKHRSESGEHDYGEAIMFGSNYCKICLKTNIFLFLLWSELRIFCVLQFEINRIDINSVINYASYLTFQCYPTIICFILHIS